MTTEERFERIETNLLLLTEAVNRYVETSNQSMKTLGAAVGALVETVAAHVANSNARMDQLDATLQAFLNSMRRSNGHGPGSEL
jgi:hypothetical protein